jgi:imidazoleglycerol-phosphate dehydratase
MVEFSLFFIANLHDPVPSTSSLAPYCLLKLAGKNSHHIIEASFKAFARALRQATEYDLRRQGTVPRSVFPY